MRRFQVKEQAGGGWELHDSARSRIEGTYMGSFNARSDADRVCSLLNYRDTDEKAHARLAERMAR